MTPTQKGIAMPDRRIEGRVTGRKGPGGGPTFTSKKGGLFVTRREHYSNIEGGETLGGRRTTHKGEFLKFNPEEFGYEGDFIGKIPIKFLMKGNKLVLILVAGLVLYLVYSGTHKSTPFLPGVNYEFYRSNIQRNS